ncbi:MAG: hypothetical protein D6811_05270 [Alphaproteobacteria bacterium]|nr:MAG: hypothetical protein D6811_05270 [Alphaproteobacteria bacterium]
MIMRLRAAVLAVGLALALAGCMEGAAGLPLFAPSAPSEMAVARGAVVITGPEGYCVDRGGSRGGARAFVLLASCASISRNPRAPRPLAPGLLTASVAPIEVEGATPDVMRAFFATADGRSLLARDGQEASLHIIESFVEGDVLYLLIEDVSPGGVPETEPRYWRGVFVLNGQLVTLSVLSFARRPLSRDAALATLRDFVRQVIEASPPMPAPALPAAAAAAPAKEPPADARGWLSGLFGRLPR